MAPSVADGHEKEGNDDDDDVKRLADILVSFYRLIENQARIVALFFFRWFHNSIDEVENFHHIKEEHQY